MSRIIKHIGIARYFKITYLNQKKGVISLDNFNVKEANEKHKDMFYHYGKDKIYLIYDDKINNIDKHIGYITLVPNTGQIGLFFLDEDYRGYTIGKQLLDNIVVESKKNGNDTIFAVTKQDHPFWKNITGGIWRSPVGEGVTCPGYSYNMKDYKFN
jgi:GNAT superfamily N-acetyltransferase